MLFADSMIATHHKSHFLRSDLDVEEENPVVQRNLEEQPAACCCIVEHTHRIASKGVSNNDKRLLSGKGFVYFVCFLSP